MHRPAITVSAEPNRPEPPQPWRSGDFVWHELMATDPVRACTFYAEVFGWRLLSVAVEGHGDYCVICQDEVEIGGIVPMGTGPNLDSHWLPYISTTALDDVVTQIDQAPGARVDVPPSQIPNIGHFGVFFDSGATPFAAFQSEGGNPPHTERRPGFFAWDQLPSEDPSSRLPLYRQLFSWSPDLSSESPGGSILLDADGRRFASIAIGTSLGTRWLPFVAVADLNDTLSLARQHGATIIEGPATFVDQGLYAVIRDPLGALLGLLDSPGSSQEAGGGNRSEKPD